MKDGICPKCGSEEVFKQLGTMDNRIPISSLRTTQPSNYICGNCGYVEWYIEKHDDLESIRRNWESANPKRKRKNDE